VLLYECCPEGEVRVHSLLEQEGYDLIACEDGEQLLEAAMKQRPDAVVYVFKQECAEDLGVLQLLRRLAPAAPIVVLANATSLRLQRLVQHLRPIYYAVAPVDALEIRSAVQSALNRRSSAAGA
jgi:DNA-binding response OmpR family regulator